jgi:hypothetical protein
VANGLHRPFSRHYPCAVRFHWILSFVAAMALVDCSTGRGEHNSVVSGASNGLCNVDILLIRHAEKPESGPGLSPVGVARADAYVKYFQGLSIGSRVLTPDCLIAAADSDQSSRPRLTLEPLGKALKLPINDHYGASQVETLGEDLRATPHGACILICWRHGGMPRLLAALGAKPSAFLPGDTWPEEEYGWIIHLRYDSEGRLVRSLSKPIIQPPLSATTNSQARISAPPLRNNKQ